MTQQEEEPVTGCEVQQQNENGTGSVHRYYRGSFFAAEDRKAA
jgi:hypothetical protein